MDTPILITIVIISIIFVLILIVIGVVAGVYSYKKYKQKQRKLQAARKVKRQKLTEPAAMTEKHKSKSLTIVTIDSGMNEPAAPSSSSSSSSGVTNASGLCNDGKMSFDPKLQPAVNLASVSSPPMERIKDNSSVANDIKKSELPESFKGQSISSKTSNGRGTPKKDERNKEQSQPVVASNRKSNTIIDTKGLPKSEKDDPLSNSTSNKRAACPEQVIGKGSPTPSPIERMRVKKCKSSTRINSRI